MGYFYQEGIFRSGDLNYNKFNLRSNISTEVAKGIKFELGVRGISDERNTPSAAHSISFVTIGDKVYFILHTLILKGRC